VGARGATRARRDADMMVRDARDGARGCFGEHARDTK